jgi:pimeloyl-ACP methyl ester carboxylesterase
MKTNIPLLPRPLNLRESRKYLDFNPQRFRVVTRKEEVLFLGGMFSLNKRQWGNRFPLDGFRAYYPEYPGHSNNLSMNLADVHFRDFVRSIVEEVRSSLGKVSIVGHSLGSLVALEVARQCPDKVKFVCMIAAAPPKGVGLPKSLVKRMVKPYYLRALFGHPFRLLADDAILVKDGSNAEIQAESGHILREVSLGIPAPKVNTLSCHVAMIVTCDDGFVPFDTQMETVQLLGVKEHIRVRGGHFSFCQNGYARETISVVTNLLNRNK